MRRSLLAATLALTVAWALPATAQGTRTARGTVTAIGAGSVTVQVQGQEMKFNVDTSTTVIARGAGTKERQAAAAGKSGPAINEVVKVGEAVEVNYKDMKGSLHASRITAITQARLAADAAGRTMANGTITSMSANSITISGRSGGGSTFTQTFSIDDKTRVMAKGASTLQAARGGPVPFTDLVHQGDHVSVSYEKAGAALHANEVRVTVKSSDPRK